MHLYTVAGILFIVPIVDFALAAPVLAQEKHQACAEIANIPKYPVTVIGKRGGPDEIVEAGGRYIDKWFGKQEVEPAALPSSSLSPSVSDHEWVDIKQPPPPYNTEGLSQESTLTGVRAPMSSPVLPNWFLTDHGYMGPHAPQPELGSSDHSLVVEPPSRPASPALSEADHGYQVVHPRPPSPITESDYDMVDVPPSSSVSSTKPDRRSVAEDSQ